MPPSLSTIRPTGPFDDASLRPGRDGAVSRVDGSAADSPDARPARLPDRFERSLPQVPSGQEVNPADETASARTRVARADQDRERQALARAAAELAGGAGGGTTAAAGKATKGDKIIDPFLLKPVPEDPFARARADFDAKLGPMWTKQKDAEKSQADAAAKGVDGGAKPGATHSTKEAAKPGATAVTKEADPSADKSDKDAAPVDPVLTRWLAGGVDGGHVHSEDGCTYCQKAVSTFVRAK